jgi:pimeloyl-ACP methyl ester carboxylesterase
VILPNLALIHSPLVGPMTWRATAESLRGLGYTRVETPSACAWEVEEPMYEALAGRIADQLGPGPWLLIGHSGAGGLIPAIGEGLIEGASGAIFVDALLPHPAKAWMDTAPPALAESLRQRTRAGDVPPWPAWFGSAAVEALLPEPAVRAAFVAEARAVPAAYLSEPAPSASSPSSCAFLQLSDGYAAEAKAASALGWTVASEPSHHLAMITRPDMVAGALHRLIQTMSLRSGSQP